MIIITLGLGIMDVTRVKMLNMWPAASGLFEVPHYIVYTQIGRALLGTIYTNVYKPQTDYYVHTLHERELS